MIRALMEKELRQHAVTFAFLFALLLVGLAAINGNRFLNEFAGTGLEGMRLLLLTLVPLGSIMMGHVLIATEFGRKTQLFLEGLPLPRWRLLSIKYLLGLFVLAAGSAAALAIAFQSESESGALTSRYVLIVSAKTAVWLLFAYSLFFTHALLGRYRLPVAIATFFLLVYLGQKDLAVNEFPAFQLIDERFSYEAHHLPVRQLWQTFGISAALVAVAFWIGLARDATLAGVLARRMSPQEKLAFAFVTIAGIASLGYAIERQEHNEAVRMPGAVEWERGAIRVAGSAAVTAPTSAELAAVQRIVPLVGTELERVAEYLGCQTMPSIFIVHRRDFKADRIEKGELKPKQGLMLRVNLTSDSFREDQFVEHLLWHVFNHKSSGRATAEANAWVLAGFPRWWVRTHTGLHKKEAQASVKADQKPPEKIELTEQSVKRWFTIDRKLGTGRALAVAAVGLAILEKEHGSDACRKFLRAMLANDVPKDARGWLRDVLDPVPRRFERITGASWAAFISQWNNAGSPRTTSTR